MHRTLALGLTAFFLASPTIAAERTVTLAVDNMTCVTCPYIVEQALSAVPGVTDVEVSFESATAVVTFDDAAADPAALMAATTNAGFPSRPVSGSEG
ncbi:MULTISPECIES: cation transporter [Aurantimonadaceae]|uniref:Cation transporter n=1 Tax=Jiella pelagia TaxID=2986949 RepID=A0ABY7C5Q0_9HYPH|nr:MULTISPECIES: cation transporter [Aurantimonadaceae]ORE97021.1 mercuric transport protein periplasmic component [Aurantimonas sp. 22II-16-19i]WAP71407.1 cation transporter [Jiella pelagia]